MKKFLMLISAMCFLSMPLFAGGVEVLTEKLTEKEILTPGEARRITIAASEEARKAEIVKEMKREKESKEPSAEFSYQLQFENSFDGDGNHKMNLEPRVKVKKGPWKVQLEYEMPVLPEEDAIWQSDTGDGKIELEEEYKIGFADFFDYKIKNENEIEGESFKGELTHSAYFTIAKDLDIGAEFEVDYAPSFATEIEPTIKYGLNLGKAGKLGLELEAPVIDITPDYEVAGIEAIIKYGFDIGGVGIEIEIDFPYDIPDEELSIEPLIAIKGDF